MNFPHFQNFGSRCFAAFALSLLAGSLPAKADMIELTNGDHYRGIVISMTQSNMEFLSEIQGRVRLPRDKIAQITLHEVVGKPTAAAAPAAAVGTVGVVAPQTPVANAPLIVIGGNTTPTPSTAGNAVVEQMRQQGIDPKLVSQVQEQISGKSSPEAAQKFDEMMSGLLTGRVSMQDLRAQAQNSITQIRAAKKEFGDDAGDMLNGYLAILQKFVRDSASDTTITPPTAAAPSGDK